MILLELELNCFRNYFYSSVNFNKEKNIISAENAQGKTNLLEAIYLLCISRSFRTKYERETINFDSDHCTVKGKFCLDNGNIRTIIFQYTRDEGKKITINRKRVNRLSDYIGQFPIVLSSPEEYNLTSGPPAERRRFIDILLSQISIKYIYNLQDYYRIVRQRNKILSERNSQKKQILDPWNEALIEKGSQIIRDRKLFTDKFCYLIKDVYSRLNKSNEILDFKYNSNIPIPNLDEIDLQFKKKLISIQKLEFEKGVTLTGPHRDDFIFSINGKELRKYGSRGQHKTVLIALAITEYDVIKEKVNETPIILIDDLFSEIDKTREEQIVGQLQGLGQTFITTTIETNEAKKHCQAQHINYFNIDKGQISAR